MNTTKTTIKIGSKFKAIIKKFRDTSYYEVIDNNHNDEGQGNILIKNIYTNHISTVEELWFNVETRKIVWL